MLATFLAAGPAESNAVVIDWILVVVATLAAASVIAMWYVAWTRGATARRRPVLEQVVREDWPSVSVIIPAWEERSSLGRCLKSLRAIDYPSWETIIVAGGSDDTYGLAVLAAESFRSCRVIEQQPHGKPAALNAGIRVATGEVIVILDADSEVSSTWLRALVAPLDAVVRATTGNPSATRMTAISRVEQMERIAIYEVQRSVILQGSGSIALRRELIDEVGQFPIDAYADDWDLDARLATAGIVRGFCRDATLRTERPATLREYWQNEVRWRRAHLVSLMQLHRHFFGSIRSALGSLYPYLAGWGAVLLTLLVLVGLVAGDAEFGRRALALWGIAILWLLLQRVALVLQVVAYTRDRGWWRDVWAPPFLFLVTLIASCVASLTLRRATLLFKGPRRIAEDESAS